MYRFPILGLALLLLVAGATADAARLDVELADRPAPLTFTADVASVERVDHRRLPEVDVAALAVEDAANAAVPGVPLRIAQPQPLALSPATSGNWEPLADGTRLWRLRVSSPGAAFLSFVFSEFALPEGAELRFVSVERAYHTRTYTAANNNLQGRFGSPLVPGDSAILELTVPAGAEAALTLESVSHGYRDFRGVAETPRRDGKPLTHVALPASVTAAAALECEVDVNCSEGAAWQDDKRAVAEIFDGSFVCSGAMVNNVRQDCRNFFLTANHCVKSKGKASSLVFFWNYENSGCNTGDANFDDTSTGSNLRAGFNQSDFTLLELFSDPDPAFFVYHAGWDASGAQPASGTTIHHPNDLPKKISFEFDPVEDGGGFSGGWGGDHWRVTGWDVGTTEPGSSGSGLWDPAHRIVGQLHGGTGDCDGGWDEYGKLSVSWVNGASTWLDPDNTGTLAVDGLDCNGTAPPPPAPCTLGQVGDPCTDNSECCSNNCKGKRGATTCK